MIFLDKPDTEMFQKQADPAVFHILQCHWSPLEQEPPP